MTLSESTLLDLAAGVEGGRACAGCGGMMHRKPTQYPSQWAMQRYCTQACGGRAAMKAIIKTDAEMRDWIEANVDIDSAGCWNSRLKLNTSGYPKTKRAGKGASLHRVSYQVFCGPIPDGQCVCHRCDNRQCVNPAHLFLGTNSDNTADRDAKGRQARGASAGRAVLSEDDVRAIFTDPRRQADIAVAYGIGPTAIWKIKNGRSWSHLNLKSEASNG